MKFRILLAVLITACLSSLAFGQAVMIVHKDNPVNNATRAEAANYFLGKASIWPGGGKVMIVDQKKSTPAGMEFLKKIVKMEESTFKNLWVEKMLSGEALPPVNKNSDVEVVEYVKANPGAIGYVSASSPHEGVKVLNIDGASEW